MRLDKFLKVSRLIKRRTVAKEMCDQGRVLVNQKVAKASTEIRVGDELALQFGHRLLRVRVERLSENPKKEEVAQLYTLLEDRRLETVPEEG